MQDVIRSILDILEDGTPELQIAAAQILGELKPSDPAVAKALSDRLDHAEHYLGRHVLTALAAIHTKAAIRELVSRVSDSSHGDLVVHLLKTSVEDIVPQLCELYPDADAETRTRILETLAGRNSPDGLVVLEQALYEPEFTELAADALLGGVLDAAPAAKTRYVKQRLKKALTKNGEVPVEVRAQLLRVLASADPKDARAVLVKCADPGEPVAIREVALRSLRGLPLTPTQATSILELLGDKDRERIVEPAMELLVEQEKWTDAGVAQLKKLLSSRRDPLRLFAIRAFRNVPKAEVVKTLVHHLLGDVPAMSAAASEALSHNKKAVDALMRALTHEKDPLRARQIAAPLSRLGEALKPQQSKNLLERGCKALLARDELGEVFLGVLLATRGEDGAHALVDKALRLRRTRKLAEASTILMFLATGDHLDQEGRYQLALTRLLLDGAQPGGPQEPAFGGDATMGYFAVLIREAFPVFERLRKETMVTPEALLRVGRHFASAVGNERRFGADLLEFLAERHGRQRAGEEAKLALRAGGL